MALPMPGEDSTTPLYLHPKSILESLLFAEHTWQKCEEFKVILCTIVSSRSTSKTQDPNSKKEKQKRSFLRPIQIRCILKLEWKVVSSAEPQM